MEKKLKIAKFSDGTVLGILDKGDHRYEIDAYVAALKDGAEDRLVEDDQVEVVVEVRVDGAFKYSYSPNTRYNSDGSINPITADMIQHAMSEAIVNQEAKDNLSMYISKYR